MDDPEVHGTYRLSSRVRSVDPARTRVASEVSGCHVRWGELREVMPFPVQVIIYLPAVARRDGEDVAAGRRRAHLGARRGRAVEVGALNRTTGGRQQAGAAATTGI